MGNTATETTTPTDINRIREVDNPAGEDWRCRGIHTADIAYKLPVRNKAKCMQTLSLSVTVACKYSLVCT